MTPQQVRTIFYEFDTVLLIEGPKSKKTQENKGNPVVCSNSTYTGRKNTQFVSTYTSIYDYCFSNDTREEQEY